MREQRSKISMDDLNEELKKKLFPGIKNAQSAMYRLESLQTAKAVELAVTTRQIGFGVVHLFVALRQFNNVAIQGNVY
ncbi:unnamed protein product [Ceutorhynchus assimilis]|uniref:Uncharacterized protein n=1 Tax=Ceutorhynchus assimilis TaxID=467358 RepID=A0A9N9QS89_9CUCU|nr:unnamed protein product [Ceutorhynchus assimilis]